MNYYISDLHLFHENSIKFDERPLTAWMKCMRQSRNDGIVNNKWRQGIYSWRHKL